MKPEQPEQPTHITTYTRKIGLTTMRKTSTPVRLLNGKYGIAFMLFDGNMCLPIGEVYDINRDGLIVIKYNNQGEETLLFRSDGIDFINKIVH